MWRIILTGERAAPDAQFIPVYVPYSIEVFVKNYVKIKILLGRMIFQNSNGAYYLKE